MKKTKEHIDFLFNGKHVHIDFSKSSFSPTTTLLNWSREFAGHKELKEGCAEGDCGACTVVIVEVDSNGRKLIYRAVNSCILFLPSLDGKLVITSKGLVPSTSYFDELHPVQQAIVEQHASQCGFCTPGFIMSIFALYHSNEKHNDENINNALSGNLCRCTGYDSIRKAAKSALQNQKDDYYSKHEKALIQNLKELADQDLILSVKSKEYIRPRNLKDLLAFRSKFTKAIIINGSSDIALKQSKHFEKLALIIDISGINELKGFEKTDTDITIGAGLSLENIKQSVKGVFPALYDALTVFASRQIRNVATIGGTLGSASPIGDLAPLIIAMNSRIFLSSEKAEREIPANKFITAYRQSVLQKDEIINRVCIPLPLENEIVKFYKISKRENMDISTLSVAISLKLSDNKVIDKISLVFGGMAATTMHAVKTENFLKKKSWNKYTINQAMLILKEEFTPLSDARSAAEFRNIAAANILMKFYDESIIK